MRSVPQDDLSTKARIRDAAIRLYARDGFSRTSLRAIATEAGVSPGLLIHHFGSAAGLREACDTHILGLSLERATTEVHPEGIRNLIQEFSSDPGRFTQEMDYLRHALLEGSETSAVLFQHLVDLSEEVILAGVEAGTVHRFSNPRGVAVLLTLTSLSTLAFGPFAAQALGMEDNWQNVLQRIGEPGLELYTHGFYTSDAFLTAFREAGATQQQSSPESQNGSQEAPDGTHHQR